MRRSIYITTLLIWLAAVAARATAIWAPTWAEGEAASHVKYDDSKSILCGPSRAEALNYLGEKQNGFFYKNTVLNKFESKLNLEYYLTDKVTFVKGRSYIINFTVSVNYPYNFNDTKVKLQLRDGTTSTANVLKDLGEISLKGISTISPSLAINSAPAEGYVCLVLTGTFKEWDSFQCHFNDFSIHNSDIKPIITNKPATTLNINLDKIPTLNVTAIGADIAYKWYAKAPTATSWTDIGVAEQNYKPENFGPGYQFKCVVSNRYGTTETEPVTVEEVIVMGTEDPESGLYYASVSLPCDYALDENTVAYKAKWNNAKTALTMDRVVLTDPYIPKQSISGGLILQSTSEYIWLSIPKSDIGRRTFYDDNVLKASTAYEAGKTYLFGFKDNKKVMSYSSSKGNFYEGIYVSGTTYSDGIEMVFPKRCDVRYRVKPLERDEVTGTMERQILVYPFDITLNASQYKREGYVFKGWSIKDAGVNHNALAYTDQQYFNNFEDGDSFVLYALWHKLDDQGNFPISSNDDWKVFCTYVKRTNNVINAKLEADITAAGENRTEAVGTESKPYTGIFDGNGHKITVNYTSYEPFAAPFSVVGTSTIKNLTVEGDILTYNQCAGGIIGFNQGSGTILDKCVSNVNIVAASDGYGGHGGLVAKNHERMSITDCAFTGSIVRDKTGQYKPHSCGGLVGWALESTYIRNCLFTGFSDIDLTGCHTFGDGDVTVYNSFFTNTMGDIPSGATYVTPDILQNGEILTRLGSGWAITLGTDAIPTPFIESKKATTNYVYFVGPYWRCDHFELKDKDRMDNIGVRLTAQTLSYDRTFTVDDGYHTVYLPFSIPTTNGKLYACTGINAEKSQAEFTEVTTTKPNTAYIFKPSTTRLDLGSEVEIMPTTGLNSQTGYLRGVYSLYTFNKNNNANCYGYAANTQDGYNAGAFVKFGTGATLPAGRAYIYAPEATQAGAKRLDMVIDGEATGISLPLADSTDDDATAPSYNLAGQCVGNGYKGIVIVNGKKMLRK